MTLWFQITWIFTRNFIKIYLGGFRKKKMVVFNQTKTTTHENTTKKYILTKGLTKLPVLELT